MISSPSRYRGAWRISAIPEDVAVMVGSFGPSIRDQQHEYSVRGVRVSLLETGAHKDEVGRMYRWCVFPDQRIMLVNEGNIIARRVSNAAANGKAPSGFDGGDLGSAG